MTPPPGSSNSTHHRGRRGESRAAQWLASRGYRILARNHRTPVGEIDLIAVEGDTLCFVEVKARRSSSYGPAIAGVGVNQQRRVARAAALYIANEGWEGACRFDVLGLDLVDEDWRFTLIRDAFEAA